MILTSKPRPTNARTVQRGDTRLLDVVVDWLCDVVRCPAKHIPAILETLVCVGKLLKSLPAPYAKVVGLLILAVILAIVLLVDLMPVGEARMMERVFGGN